MTTSSPDSAAVQDWMQDEMAEALDDQVVDGAEQLAHWKLRMSMNTDQSEREDFHLNGGEVVDLGVPMLEEPLLAVKLFYDEAHPNKTFLVGSDMGCRNWRSISINPYPGITDSNLEDCKQACLDEAPECTDFSYNEDGTCETWKGTCIGWNDGGWSYYTFKNKPFRPNFQSIAGRDEVSVSFWMNWHEMVEPTIVSEFFQFQKLELDNGQLSGTTRGGDNIVTSASSCANIAADAFHQLAFAFSKSESTISVFVDGSLCQTSDINWVDEPQGIDFGLPVSGKWTGLVTGFKGFGRLMESSDMTPMYEDMAPIYAAATYAFESAPVVATLPPPVVTTAAPPVVTPAPTVTPAQAAKLPIPTYPRGEVPLGATCTTAIDGSVQWCIGAADSDDEESCDDICSAHGGCMEDCWLGSVPEFGQIAGKVGLKCSTTQMGGAPFDPSIQGTVTVNCGVSTGTASGGCEHCDGQVVDHELDAGRCGVRPDKQAPKVRRLCPCGATGDTCGFTKTV